jgi:hypothetical protein
MSNWKSADLKPIKKFIFNKHDWLEVDKKNIENIIKDLNTFFEVPVQIFTKNTPYESWDNKGTYKLKKQSLIDDKPNTQKKLNKPYYLNSAPYSGRMAKSMEILKYFYNLCFQGSDNSKTSKYDLIVYPKTTDQIVDARTGIALEENKLIIQNIVTEKKFRFDSTNVFVQQPNYKK